MVNLIICLFILIMLFYLKSKFKMKFVEIFKKILRFSDFSILIGFTGALVSTMVFLLVLIGIYLIFNQKLIIDTTDNYKLLTKIGLLSISTAVVYELGRYVSIRYGLLVDITDIRLRGNNTIKLAVIFGLAWSLALLLIYTETISIGNYYGNIVLMIDIIFFEIALSFMMIKHIVKKEKKINRNFFIHSLFLILVQTLYEFRFNPFISIVIVSLFVFGFCLRYKKEIAQFIYLLKHPNVY